MGDLTITRELVMCEIPRGDDVLRVTFTEGRTPEGRDVAWHSIRVFYKSPDGQWKPGKQGITIRGKELRAVSDALSKASSGGPAAMPRPTTQFDAGDADGLF